MENTSPLYQEIAHNGRLAQRVNWGRKQLQDCTLCPWECHVNRLAGEKGQCQGGAQARVYAYMAHHGEERPISGQRGSGTIFFSGCSLHCQFCQNATISQENRGISVDGPRLAEMMLELQGLGCHNINLVTPTHFVPQILEALLIACGRGLNLPLIYNNGGYEKIRTLRALEDVIDVYLPDMKYADPALAWKYSRVHDYPQINRNAVKEMFRQVGNLQLDRSGLAVHGLLIRHLLLPNGLAGTQEILHFIASEISHDAYVNVMGQYRPDFHAGEMPELNSRISPAAYAQVLTWVEETGLKQLEA